MSFRDGRISPDFPRCLNQLRDEAYDRLFYNPYVVIKALVSERVVVVGAGVIGLLTARELALAKLWVTLMERDGSGREASWARGGIVSPLYPRHYSPTVIILAHWSQDFYPALGQRLLDETGLDPEVHTVGLYWLDLDGQTEALQWARNHTRPLKEVPIEEAYATVPGLGVGFQRAACMSGVANARNPCLARSLRASLQQFADLELHEQTEVHDWLHDGDRVVGMATSRGEIRGDKVLLTAGAWSGELLKPLGLELPVVPVKRQIVLYRCTADFLPRMVLAKGRYATPRRDGHILIDGILEHSGFDKAPTDEALESLGASAAELLPELTDMQPMAHWAGLRSSSPGDIPYVGPVPSFDGFWLSTGHYRNGLVLAPASCRLLADLMNGRESIINPAPYTPIGHL